MRDQRPTVFIVDDDAAVRDSLAWLLESVGLSVRRFASPREFLAQVHADLHGCVILDVRMPRMSGLEVHTRLGNAGITLPVLIITGHADVPMAVRALKAGVFDFIEKPFNDQHLLDRVHAAIAEDGERRNSEQRARDLRRRLSALTARERQVLEQVTRGIPNKRIAVALDISIKTVETHRAKIMQKLDAHSVTDLMRLVIQADDQ